MIDDAIQETACLYVLGMLSMNEASSFEADAAADPELQKLVTDLKNSAAALAAGVSPRSPSAEVRTEILKKIANRARANRSALPPSAGATPPLLREVTTPKSGPGVVHWVGWIAAACFMAGCLVLYRQQSKALEDIAALRDERKNLTDAAESMAKALAERNADDPLSRAAAARLAPTKDATAESKDAAAVAVIDLQNNRGVIKVQKLLPTAKKDYELWFLDGPKPVSCGVLKVGADGVATYAFNIGAHQKIDAFAISLEKEGGDGVSPKGPVIMVGPL